MQSAQRLRFKSSQDWNNFIGSNKQLRGQELFELRRVCYQEIEELRKRPLLVYATRFLENLPPGTPNFIDIFDVDGFTDLVNSIRESKSADILLHSPRGRPDATERIVSILRNKFENITFLIPHSAYSAATMLALSGNTIIMHQSATLGPIDPQIDGIPARSIKRGFEKVKKIVIEEGPEALPAYIPLIEKYSLDLLEICEDSEKLSKELVKTWLTQYMFEGKKGHARRINKAVNFFSDYDKHLLHSRPILFEKLKEYDLKNEQPDKELAELLWEAYILINGFFSVAPFVKLYECIHGVSWGKQLHISMTPQPDQIKAKKQHNK